MMLSDVCNYVVFIIITGLYSHQFSTWFFTTFSVSGIKDKVRYLDSLQQLFTCIKPEEIDIPPFVLEYDIRVRTITHHTHTGIRMEIDGDKNQFTFSAELSVWYLPLP